jgi:cytidine deaminase
MTDQELVAAAWEAREHAAAPYSNYRVGAALLSDSGELFTGANVESSSYGLSICAERVALFKAVTADVRKFTRIAIAAEGKYTPVPCGACRQLLADYASGIEVLLSGSPNQYEKISLSELLPRPFNGDFIK